MPGAAFSSVVVLRVCRTASYATLLDTTMLYSCSCPSIVPVCASRKYRRYIAVTGTTPHTATSGFSHVCREISQAL